MKGLEDVVPRYKLVEDITEHILDSETVETYFSEFEKLDYPLDTSKNLAKTYPYSSKQYIGSTFLLSQSLSDYMEDIVEDEGSRTFYKNRSEDFEEHSREFLESSTSPGYKKSDYSLLLNFYRSVSQDLDLDSNASLAVITSRKSEVKDELDELLEDVYEDLNSESLEH